MGQLSNIVTIINAAVAVGVLLVAIGRWVGKTEARRGGNPMSTSPSDAVPNGLPTIGELGRRLQKLEDDRRVYARRREIDEHFRAHEETHRRQCSELWDAIKDLRVSDSAITRRVDGLVGQ